MLNVAMISHSPNLCGAERMLLNLATALRDTATIKPVVFVPDAEHGLLSAFLDQEKIEWYCTPAMPWYLYAKIENAVDYISRSLKIADTYFEYLKVVNADIVIINTLTSMEGVFAAVKSNLPFIVWGHGVLDASIFEQIEYFARFCENVTLQLARKLICCSQWTANGLKHMCDTDKVAVIHNWTHVGSTLRKPDNSTQGFTALSTFDKHKGLDVIIKAVDLLHKRGRNVRVCLYGDGAQVESLKALAKERNLENHVLFLDRTADVNAVYDESRALLLPSYVEPFGMVAIEAMSRATPVIASRTGGIPEIIDDGVNGLLFWPGDHEDLADKMEALLEDIPLVEEIRENGYRRVREAFDGTIAIGKFQEIITNECRKFSGYSKSDQRIIDAVELFAIQAVGAAAAVSDKFFADKVREAVRIYIARSWFRRFLFRALTSTRVGISIKQKVIRFIDKLERAWIARQRNS